MRFVTILIFLFGGICLGQEVMTIAATIVDSKTQQPVEFVNVGFIEKGIGTVSDEDGRFSLTFRISDIKKKDILQISSIGYETKSFSLDELNKLISYQVKIPIVFSEVQLNSVIVKAEKRQYEKLGTSTYSNSDMGYWRNKEGLGGELATHIRIDHANTRLHDLKFNIIENLSDSLLVRINVYDYFRNAPGKNLTPRNIYHTVTKKKGVETVPLEDYNIVVHDDVIVSLELVEVYGDAIYLALSVSSYGGTSFKREISQDRWRSFAGTGLGFGLLASYSEEPKQNATRLRVKPSKLLIYWDSSFGMKNRNIDEELTLLSKYLKVLANTHRSIDVKVINFSNQIVEEATFNVVRGKSKSIIEYLKGIEYNGATDYSVVLKDNSFKAQAALLFTDGTTINESLNSRIGVPVYTINGFRYAAHKQLDELSFLSEGAYINLSRQSVKEGLDRMINYLEDDVTYSDELLVPDQKDMIYGVVYNDQGPIGGASVRIKNTLVEAISENNGEYRISAEDGDVLRASALGMQNKDTLVGESNKLHIPMVPLEELLDAAVVTGRIQENEPVSTPFGYKNPDAVGYSLNKTITSEDIKEFHTNLDQILNFGTRIEAKRQNESGDVKYRFIKHKYSSIALDTYAAVVVDGVVYDQNLPGVKVPELDLRQIESIQLLESAAGTLRFGSVAAFGAIVIQTKTFAQKQKSESATASLLADNNDYTESLISYEQAREQLYSKDYMLELSSANTIASAKELYFAQLHEREPTVSYFTNVANFFSERDIEFALSVISNLAEITKNNSKVFRTLGYFYDAYGRPELSTPIYELLVSLEPMRIQPYLELARNYQETGEISKAADLYKRMYSNDIPNVDFNPVATIVINELKHLVAKHKSKIYYDDLPAELLKVGFKQDVRLVFEWSDPFSEFEIQFVNPNKKYFTYSHTFFNNKENLKKEVQLGYHIKEFIIDGADPGTWLVNLKQLGEKELGSSVFIKYTLYKNYGLPSEERIVKVINLQDFETKVTLDNFVY